MKDFRYIKPRPLDFEMCHQHDVVDIWLYEVANQEGNLDFLDQDDFHAEMVLAYIEDNAAYYKYCCSPRSQEYWEQELKLCEISEDDISSILANLKKEDPYADSFDAAKIALENKFWSDSIIVSSLADKFYERFCRIDVEDIEEVEETNEN